MVDTSDRQLSALDDEDLDLLADDDAGDLEDFSDEFFDEEDDDAVYRQLGDEAFAELAASARGDIDANRRPLAAVLERLAEIRGDQVVGGEGADIEETPYIDDLGAAGGSAGA